MSYKEQLDNQQCRTCYNSKNNLQTLKCVPEAFPSQQAEQISYSQLLLEVCNINVMLDIPPGHWPQFICLACSQKLKSAYDFIQQTHKINIYLKSVADQLLVKSEINFIEKPELDISLEIKIETDNDMDLSASERVFQHSPLETTPVKSQTLLATDDNECEDIKDNSFIVTEYPNEISEDDTKHKKHVNNTDISKSNSAASTLACNECNKLFTSVSKLNRHKRFTHVPDEEKHPCHLCDLKFARTYHFKRHLQTVHSRDNFQPKPVNKDKHTILSDNGTATTCNECKKIFYNPKKLARHKRLVHVPEEKKFTCHVCGNKFGRSDHFRRHMRNLHNTDALLPPKRQVKLKDNRFACDKCDRSYTRRCRLYKHERDVHCQ